LKIGLYKIVSKIEWRALKRQIYPHLVLQTGATDDAKRFTDSKMMIRHGWSNAGTTFPFSSAKLSVKSPALSPNCNVAAAS
jgi:hypothetical protein